MQDVTGKEVIAKLKAAGWSLDRVNGSHHILTKDGKAVPVPVHGGRDLGAGLLAAIQRQSGVKLK
jgi:predicted RNA binding protein YcfA (HicA-like mRNA interferase family)